VEHGNECFFIIFPLSVWYNLTFLTDSEQLFVIFVNVLSVFALMMQHNGSLSPAAEMVGKHVIYDLSPLEVWMKAGWPEFFNVIVGIISDSILWNSNVWY
jgi:hypothetical protein